MPSQEVWLSLGVLVREGACMSVWLWVSRALLPKTSIKEVIHLRANIKLVTGAISPLIVRKNLENESKSASKQ